MSRELHWRSRAHIEPLHQSLAMMQQTLLDQQQPTGIAMIALIAEYGRLAGNERCDQTQPLTVLGHVGDADRSHFRRGARRLRGDQPTIGDEATGRRWPDAGEQFEQFALAVAADPGDSDDLAGAEAKAGPIDAGHTAFVTQGQP